MTINATKIDAANATIDATIANEEIQANIEKIAKERGYRPGWAKHVWAAKQTKQQTRKVS